MFKIEKENLEILIIYYIFSNLKKGKNVNRYAESGFCKIKENSNKNGSDFTIIEYKLHSEYCFDDGDNEKYEELIQIEIENKEVYTKKECENIREKMYLNNTNNVAFILKILNPNAKFI